MRVTLVLAGFPRLPVGGCRVIYEYANRLSGRGHCVFVVHCRDVRGVEDADTFYKRLRRYLFFIYLSIVKPAPSWQPIAKSVRMLFVPSPQERYIPDSDIVFVTWWPLLEYVLGYGVAKGKKCYLFQHYETWSGPQDKVDDCWRSSLYKVVVSRWLYDIGQKLNASKMRYIPNGINHDLFRVMIPIEGRQKVVAMMYSQQVWKGSEEGMKVLFALKGQVPDLRANIFGVSPFPGQLPDWIRFYRNPSQKELVENIYNKSAVFLCMSRFEGFALPPAEAMACGCAVVTTDCGGVRDFSLHGVNSLIGPVGDVEGLARYCKNLIQDDGLRVRLAHAGVESIKRLDWKKSVDDMEDFLEQCGNENPAV